MYRGSRIFHINFFNQSSAYSKIMNRSSLSIVFSVLVIIVGTLTITSNTILGSSNTITAAYAQENNNNNNNIVNDNNPTSATVGGQRVSFLTDDKVLIVGTYYA